MSEQSVAVRAPHLPVLPAGNPVLAIVPSTFEDAYRIATVVVKAGMAPKSLTTIEQCMVAIMHGLEVGLTPMNALQSIAVINGRPTIWGDGAIGLIRASGKLEWMQETFEGTGESLKAVCTVKRKGEPQPVRGEFSWEDAKRAGLTGKAGPWQTYPRRMLQMRARWPLRDVFSDVLKGLSLREEVEDMARSTAPETPPETAPAPQLRAPPPPPDEPKKDDPISSGPISVAAPMGGAASNGQAGKIEPAADDAFPGDKPLAPLPASEQKWLTLLRDTFEQCTNKDELDSVAETEMGPMVDTASEEAWKEAQALYNAVATRFSHA